MLLPKAFVVPTVGKRVLRTLLPVDLLRDASFLPEFLMGSTVECLALRAGLG